MRTYWTMLLITLMAALPVTASGGDLGERPTRRTPQGPVTEPEFASPMERENWMVDACGVPPADTGFEARVEEAGKSYRNIRVTGRFGYYRPDGRLVGVTNVYFSLYDDDDGWDDNDLIYQGFTDEQGYFDITFLWDDCALCEDPDLWLLCSAFGPDIIVDDLETDFYDFGLILPPSEDKRLVAQVRNVANRTWRWLGQRGYPSLNGFATGVAIHNEPSDFVVGWDSWNRQETYQAIIRRYDVWDDAHVSAIVMQHFLYWYAELWADDLCNGLCESGPQCGYCLWCPESFSDAWQLGFGEGIGQLIADSFEAEYGLAPFETNPVESLGDCPLIDDDPRRNPGYFAAFLYDAFDPLNDDHPQFPGVRDRLGLSAYTLLDAVVLGSQWAPEHFIQTLMQHVPTAKAEIWETAANCGIDVDDMAPYAITDLNSPSHPVGSSSTDVTVDFEWTIPGDDASGVAGYAYEISASPTSPGNSIELGPDSSFTTDPIAPGTWYCTLRVVDRAGNWQTGYATYGPFTIYDPTPADLAHELQPGWSEPVVPRSDAGATPGNVVVSSSLVGGSDTYWSTAPKNIGGQSTGKPLGAQLYVDGNRYFDLFNPGIGSATIPTLAGHTAVELLNNGPVTVRAGRHTLGVELDFGGGLSETDELNNGWARNWVWQPSAVITPGLVLGATNVPDYNGGWNFLGGGLLWPNSLGVRFQSTGRWNAFFAFADYEDSDFDIHLHQASTGPEDGFFDVVAQSGRGERFLDAVFVNRDLTGGPQLWDAAIVQAGYEPDKGSVGYGHVTSVPIPAGVDYTDQLGPGEPIHLREFDLLPGYPSQVSIVVDVDPSQGKLTVLRLHSDYDVGHIGSHNGIGVTDDEGHARLRFDLPDPGNMCVVLYRNKWHNDYDGPLDYTLRIENTPPDMQPDVVGGWHAPIVPRSTSDATPTSVPAPTALTGWQPGTWFSVAQENIGDTDAVGPLATSIRIDGVELWNQPITGTVSPQGHHVFNNLGVFSVKGGRHTLSMHSDALDDIVEISETNNAYGEQWTWSPYVAGWVPVPGMSQPAPRTGGWAAAAASGFSELWYNAEGFRTPAVDPGTSNIYWVAAAVTPEANSDVDIRLHDPDDDPTTGLTQSLAGSHWGVGKTDFVLINYWFAPVGSYDFGVLGVSGSGGYQYDLSYDDGIFAAQGSHGPFTLASNELIGLHHFWFDPGIYTIELQDLSATADLGFSLHGWQLSHQGKSDHVEDGIAWRAPAGTYQTMRVTVQPAEAGPYCMAVWKSDAQSAALSSDYAIKFVSVIDAPPSELAGRSGIVRIAPNPFNPRTEIVYRMKEEGMAAVSIYNLRGELVRELERAQRLAGEHRVVWDGIDGAGQSVASGVYFVEVQGAAWTDRRKITLLK